MMTIVLDQPGKLLGVLDVRGADPVDTPMRKGTVRELAAFVSANPDGYRTEAARVFCGRHEALDFQVCRHRFPKRRKKG